MSEMVWCTKSDGGCATVQTGVVAGSQRGSSRWVTLQLMAVN